MRKRRQKRRPFSVCHLPLTRTRDRGGWTGCDGLNSKFFNMGEFSVMQVPPSAVNRAIPPPRPELWARSPVSPAHSRMATSHVKNVYSVVLSRFPKAHSPPSGGLAMGPALPRPQVCEPTTAPTGCHLLARRKQLRGPRPRTPRTRRPVRSPPPRPPVDLAGRTRV